ncbi:MAG: sugar ABC transporter ATP-binding protein [Enterocloster asparagiformis]|nr:sugar ABC transporter ATP-binding protein [Enterocloster asparagiformis]
MPQNTVILEMKDIKKSFYGTEVLHGVDLELRKGEVLGLVGENGAGKSTLMNVLLGLHQPDEGTITFKGQVLKCKSPSDALNIGIAMIHQELRLIPSMTVSENIWLGRERKFHYKHNPVINTGAQKAATRALLEELGIDIEPGARISSLNVANMQLVEIARAVSYNTEIIIMDEPTSALASHEIELLYKIIDKLTADGVSIIFISHKLDEIFHLCHRVLALRDGNYIALRDTRELDTDELIRMIVGREMKDMYPKSGEAQLGEVALEVKNLTKKGVFNDISFSVRRGEILGFCGLMGAGRTEILNAVFGIEPADSGRIFVEGKEVRIKTPADALKCGLGMVTEDRLRRGLLHKLSVKVNISLAYLPSICSKLKMIRKKQEAEDCRKEIERLSVKTEGMNTPISSLSGGNQQKCIIGRWLLTNPKILFLDEPTRGIDVGSKAEIYRLIDQLAQEGMAIVMVSSELPEIIGMSDRVLIVRHGMTVAEFMRSELDQEVMMKHAFGT